MTNAFSQVGDAPMSDLPKLISVDLEFDFLMSQATSQNEEVLILLHGFRDHNARVLESFRDLGGSLESMILAPNAPFPFRTKSPSGEFELEYSWYFFDPDKKRYLKDMKTSLRYIEAGLEILNLTNRPKRIIGFSQGGYLAPFLGQKLKNTKQVIGIACEFYTHEMQGDFPFPIDAIHGDQDTVVRYSTGKDSHEKLSKMGILGEFHTIREGSHSLNEGVKMKVCELIQRRRSEHS